MNTPRRALSILLVLFVFTARAETKPATRPALPPGVTAEYDLHYGPLPGNAQTLDLYLPAKTDQPAPLIVWIHGGGWSGGDKQGCPALGLVPRGFAAASLNYRLVKGAENLFPAQIHDCKGAIRWLRAHAAQYHIDPNHVGVWGASAGGHLVALIGTSGEVKEIEGDVGGNLDQSSRVQCVCDFFGPTDMSLFFQQAESVENIFKAKPEASPICHLFGGPVAEHTELVRQANPIAFIQKDCPPFLIIHGDKDPLVPLAQSQILVDALNKAGVGNHLEVLKGAGHGGPQFNAPSVRSMIWEFFDKHLKGAK